MCEEREGRQERGREGGSQCKCEEREGRQGRDRDGNAVLYFASVPVYVILAMSHSPLYFCPLLRTSLALPTNARNSANTTTTHTTHAIAMNHAFS